MYAVALLLIARSKWIEAMDRQTGKFYVDQVRDARDRYFKEQKIDPNRPATNIAGFDRWRKENLK